MRGLQLGDPGRFLKVIRKPLAKDLLVVEAYFVQITMLPQPLMPG